MKNPTRRLLTVLAALSLLLAACAGTSSPPGATGTSAPGPAGTGPTTTITTPPIADLVAASKTEHDLLIYGNPPADNFAPIVDAFKAAYPWVKVQFSNLSDNESFAKYEAEQAQGARTADILIASAPTNWVNSQEQGVAKADFVPGGLSNFPAFAKQLPGIFVMSPEPILNAWNPKLVPDADVPTSYAKLVAAIQTKPGVFAHKLVTYPIDNGLGYAAIYGMDHIAGSATVDTWLNALGPNSKTFGEGLSAVKEILQGGSNYDWTVSGLAKGVLKSLVSSGLAQYAYMTDATPLVPRGIAVTQGGKSPASAELFLDFLFSKAGQDALCKGGFTAYMNDYKPVDGCVGNLADVYGHVAKKNTYVVPFSKEVVDAQKGIVARWNKAFGR